MKSRATRRFWTCFEALPKDAQSKARDTYRIWRDNPRHPSLHFKLVHQSQPIFSVRIGIGWRALAVKDGETFIWFWIGSHAAYDRLISTL